MFILYSVGLKMEDPSLSISIDYFQSSPSRILNRIFPFTEIKEGSPTADELEGLSEKISDKWKKLHLCPEMHAMAKMAKLAKNRQPLAI